MVSPLAYAAGGEEAYQRAIALNQQGHGAQALPILSQLKNEFPDNPRYLSDFIAIASSSGEHVQALGARVQNERALPLYVLQALFRSAVAVGDLERTERLFGLLSERGNAGVDEKIRLTQLYLQRHRIEAALTLSGELKAQYRDHLGVLDLRAYVLRQAGRPGEAMIVYEQILQLSPSNKEAPVAISMILLELGSPQRAAATLERYQATVAQSDNLRLSRELGAQDTRWAAGERDRSPEQLAELNRAIDVLSSARDRALASKQPMALVDSLRANLVVAYRDAKRYKEALTEYDEILGDRAQHPTWLRVTVASCYSAVGRYEEAEQLGRQLASEAPDSADRNIAWIYALSDLERFDEAQSVADRLITLFSKTSLSNIDKASAYTSLRLTRAMVSAYRNQHAEAQDKLEALQKDAPDSLDTTEAIGIVETWRGRPRRAEEQFRMVLSESPHRLDSKLGLANARLDRGEEAGLKAVVNEFAGDENPPKSIIDARRRLELRDRYYVVANLDFGGDQEAVTGNRSREFGLKAYTRPFGEGGLWRAFGHYRNLWSGPAIPTSDQSISGGLRYTPLDWDTEMEAGANGYARLETSHSFSDEWSAGALLENNAFFRPARAVEAGVSSDIANFSLRWRRDEGLSLDSGMRFTRFSDNRRSEAYFSVNKNLFSDFNQRLSLSTRLSSQRNTNSEVAYFSPERLGELSGTLTYDFRLWQDTMTKKSAVWQKVWVTAGTVHQEGYSGMPMSGFGIGQEIILTDASRLLWSLGRTRYPFDGVGSSYFTGNVRFEGYF